MNWSFPHILNQFNSADWITCWSYRTLQPMCCSAVSIRPTGLSHKVRDILLLTFLGNPSKFWQRKCCADVMGLWGVIKYNGCLQPLPFQIPQNVLHGWVGWCSSCKLNKEMHHVNRKHLRHVMANGPFYVVICRRQGCRNDPLFSNSASGGYTAQGPEWLGRAHSACNTWWRKLSGWLRRYASRGKSANRAINGNSLFKKPLQSWCFCAHSLHQCTIYEEIAIL